MCRSCAITAAPPRSPNSYPYQEIVQYCHTHRDQIETVFKTLSYFDGVNLSFRARGKALFSAGLMDPICPPSTVFAAYNYYGGPKDIRLYPYNQHEGGGQLPDGGETQVSQRNLEIT